MPPKRQTRSGGPPQSAAVVNPIRASSKRKRKVRQPSTSQRPTPTPSNANADATEDAGDAHFLRLSRIAALLRDAAADHPSAHGPLLGLPAEVHWPHTLLPLGSGARAMGYDGSARRVKGARVRPTRPGLRP